MEKESTTASPPISRPHMAGDNKYDHGSCSSPPNGRHIPREATENVSQQLESQYVDGVPLLLVMGAVTVACFLVLLDATIIATVSGLVRVAPITPRYKQFDMRPDIVCRPFLR
jgi:hypothetical protein